jgi:uncharacterized membrane protein
MSSSFVRVAVVLVSSLAFATVACGSEPEEPTTGDPAEVKAVSLSADKVKRCHGTEPFWGLNIDDKTVTWELDTTKRTIENSGARPAIGSVKEFASIYQGRTVEDPDRFLSVMVTAAQEGGCILATSEKRMPFNVAILSGTEYYLGCCR